MTTRSGLHVNAQYRRDPWGYAGMVVRIYRPVVKGPARMTRLYAMRSARGRDRYGANDGRLGRPRPARGLGCHVPACHEGRTRGLGFGPGIGGPDGNAEDERRTRRARGREGRLPHGAGRHPHVAPAHCRRDEDAWPHTRRRPACTLATWETWEPCAGRWSRSLAQLAQHDEQFVWKRVAEARTRQEDLRRPPFRPPARWAGMAAGNGLAETRQQEWRM